MTAIAAVRVGSNVVMGGDSAGTSGWSLTLREDLKVFHVGRFLVGYTSSFRMGQALRFGSGDHSLETLKPQGDPFEFMVRRFVPVMRSILKDAGYMKISNSEESAGTFLVAWGKHLFEVASDLQVGIPLDPYAACGCGRDLILGSLFSTRGRGKPRDRIKLALQAAERHSAGVRGPFVIEET